MYHLSNLINSNPRLHGWLVGLLIIFFWWLLLWLIARFMIKRRIRPTRVIILSFTVIFLVGAIFTFNLVMAPIILFLFYPLVLFCLIVCFITAIAYLVKVDDSEYIPRRELTATDPFKVNGLKRKAIYQENIFLNCKDLGNLS